MAFGVGETAKLETILTLKDGLTPGLNKSITAVGKFDKGVGRAGRGVGKLGKSVAAAGLLAGGAVVTGLAAAAKAAIDYQDAFQGVVKTVDSADLKAAGLTFDDLSNAIRKMSREMPNSAIELAGIAEAAGALGIKAKDVEAFTRQVAILASTTNVSAEDAATALGQLQNVIGLTGDEFDNFAAALVDLGNKGASTEADILEIARRAGGAAKLFGIAKDATLGWAAAAANLGLNSELAGTSLQNVFLKLMPAVSKGSKTLATIMGKSAADIRRAFKKDASGALEDLLKKLGKMPKDARLDAVQRIFGKGSGITRLVLGLADSVDKNLTPALNTSAQAWKDSTAAAAEFEKRNATVKSAFLRLKNTVLDAAVTVGEGFAPALGRAADKLAEFLGQDANRSKLKNLGEDIGKAIDKIDFDKLLKASEGVVRALTPAVGILTKIAEAIGKLPPELLGAGGALVITNKITGGLVIKGVEDIVGGLGKSLAVGLASNIPLFGKAFVQPVFVTNMGAGLPGGGGATPVPTPGVVVPLVGAVATLDMVRAQEQSNKFLNQIHGTQGKEYNATQDVLARLGVVSTNQQGTTKSVQEAKNAITANERGEGAKHRAKLSAIQAAEARNLVAFRAGERATLGVKAVTANKLAAANAKLDAIRHKRTSFRTTVNVGVTSVVSVRDTITKTTKSVRYNTNSISQAG